MNPEVNGPAADPAAPEAARNRRRRTRRRWIVLAVAGVVVVAGIAAWALLRPAGNADARGNRSFTAQAERSSQTVTVGLTGTLSPQTRSDLNFGVSGTVTKVYVSAGDTVEKGQKLARINDDDLQDALALARANLETAEANLDDVEDQGSDAAVTAARAQVKSAKASVTSAEDDLDDAVLRSPIDGTVASVDLSVGDTVPGGGSSGSGSAGSGSSGSSGSGQGVPSSSGSSGSSASTGIVVISTQTWKLDGSVGSADLASLEPGQAATVTPDGATEPITGEVTSIGIVATSTSDGSATFPVVVSLAGEHPELFSGTNASATITVAEHPDVLTVPTIAITTRDGRSVVTKVDGEATTEVEVGIGTVFGEATEITSGLFEGDTVKIQVTMPDREPADSENGGLFGGGGGFGGGGPPPGGGFPGGGGGAGGGFPGGGNR